MDWAAAWKKNKKTVISEPPCREETFITFVVLHGLQKPIEHYKTSSAERPVF